ncbi:hypothetical protein HMPREF0379_0057 [[Eubacterium] yurii subsp. margaretiae ATCC 43715]|nr:hypothetical protein HMPREF0379_0057 [[Eubacterium] yurii subsp. margaretiae ATCC 43715]
MLKDILISSIKILRNLIKHCIISLTKNKIKKDSLLIFWGSISYKQYY